MTFTPSVLKTISPAHHAFIVLFIYCSLNSHAQPRPLIELKNEQLQVIPKEFYIAAVTDERKDDTNIGSLQTFVLPGKAPAAYKVDLKGGKAALKNFISYGLPADKALRPIMIKIKELKVAEMPLPGGRVNGRIVLALSFGLLSDDEFIYLGNYDGSADYQRSAGPPQQLEPLLRNSLSNGLVYINNWMNDKADNNMKLAKGVRLIFTDHHEDLEGDTIYYNVNRPLNWTDFHEKPHLGSHFAAEIFTMIGYSEEVRLSKGIINIKLDVKVFLPKSASWVRDAAVSDYGLNHEQRHFDITRLVAEHFKQRLKKEEFTISNYDAPINMAYLDALRELEKLQKQYDTETGHSTNTYQQQQWNDKIDNELKQLGIKPKGI